MLCEVNNPIVTIWGRPEQDTISKGPSSKPGFLWWANSNSLRPLLQVFKSLQSFPLNVVGVATCFYPTNAVKEVESLRDLLQELLASISPVGSQPRALLIGTGEAGRKHTAKSIMELHTTQEPIRNRVPQQPLRIWKLLLAQLTLMSDAGLTDRSPEAASGKTRCRGSRHPGS